jgi:hypothetical protein
VSTPYRAPDTPPPLHDVDANARAACDFELFLVRESRRAAWARRVFRVVWATLWGSVAVYLATVCALLLRMLLRD